VSDDPVSTPETLGVVVVTHNSAEIVSECLASISAASSEVASLTLAVVDSGSSDGSLEAASAAAPDAVTLSLGSNAGYAAGINAGVRALGLTDAVLVLNPDIRLEAGSLRALRSALAVAGTGIAVPRIVDERGTVQYSLRRRPTFLRAVGEAVVGGTRAGRVSAMGEMIVDETTYDRPGVVDWATGAAMLISRSCLDEVGAWDESFFLYSEETDFALRAADAGFSVRYVPEATVVHLGGEAMTSPSLYALLTMNRLELYRRHHSRLASVFYRGALALGEVLRAPFARTHRAALRALI
jgi:GT2 family glycosyltransferase